MSAPGPVLGLDHVQLAMPAGREGDARRFYGTLLGLAELPRPPVLANRGGCWFALPGAALHLGVEDGFRPARKAHPALLVADLAGLLAVLDAAGHPSREDVALDGLARAFVDDPFGNRIELLQRLR